MNKFLHKIKMLFLKALLIALIFFDIGAIIAVLGLITDEERDIFSIVMCSIFAIILTVVSYHRLSRHIKANKQSIVTTNISKNNSQKQGKTFNVQPTIKISEPVIRISGPYLDSSDVRTENSRQINIEKLSIHEDIEGLIYTDQSGISNEPSLINEYLKVDLHADKYTTSRLSYYPSYSSMTPQQRGVYLKFLSDPYEDYEIGYVFVLYYGLECHLVSGKKDQAAYVIQKLRLHHRNSSFLGYSFDALVVYYSARNQLGEFLAQQYDELDLNYVMNYHARTDNLLPVQAVINYRKSFGFTKEAFILKAPELFASQLENAIYAKYETVGIPLNTYTPMAKVDDHAISFPANLSLGKVSAHYLKILKYTEITTLKNDIHALLEIAYDATKTGIKNY